MNAASVRLLNDKIILLVEDNFDHATLVTRVLLRQSLPKKVFHLTDGEAAIDYLLRQGSFRDPLLSPRPDVVLLDLRLPRVDGLDVLRTAKHNDGLRDIPIVVLSSSSASPDMTKAYRYHANSYLVKPLDYFQFVQTLETLSEYWLSHNKTKTSLAL